MLEFTARHVDAYATAAGDFQKNADSHVFRILIERGSVFWCSESYQKQVDEQPSII